VFLNPPSLRKPLKKQRNTKNKNAKANQKTNSRQTGPAGARAKGRPRKKKTGVPTCLPFLRFFEIFWSDLFKKIFLWCVWAPHAEKRTNHKNAIKQISKLKKQKK
jgi:hypothetical protein